ncbi:imidazoleglycerol phosphate synthase [Sistotremastrum niveocremeum HHB9708]|uniref:Imidazole glycerol phosphate synthase hisHF n=1 Tax=Sistotremastrum niveocremeum HHB9708 TaxID=1314777 RepID=A0A164XH50_9AGAM|nr:imidazoleglycerol phosphate synthase [Sistotremastrum niveocremeum HHB9708]
MGLFLLDYGAGNVRSLANSLTKLGYEFEWIASVQDFDKATRIIFPGVGAFHSAMQHLESKGFLEPLRRYIAAGKPYFGICIGMQVLFASSTEHPASPGLGVIDLTIEKFDSSEKSVPHIGWNAAQFIEPDERARAPDVVDANSSYYFVHSFRAKYDEKLPDSDWVYTTTQYGQEVFVSSVRKGNVFGTQFHPEKSGFAGLKLLKSWLESDHTAVSLFSPSKRLPQPPQSTHGLTKRVIACLDVRANDQGDLVVTKGDQYDVRERTVQDNVAGSVRNLGKPVSLAERYFTEGADEICLLNITSFRQSPLQDQPMLAVVRAAAETVFVPLTIGGGIKDSVDPDGTKRSALEVAGAYFRAGADKVSIGSEAVIAVEALRRGEDTSTCAITTIARVYGSQAVVVSIDPRRSYVDPATYEGPYKAELIHGKNEGPESGKAWWYQCTVSGGRETRPLSAVELARGVEELGAGEILLNSIDRDGTGKGFDLDLIRLIRTAVHIPLVASSGAGAAAHFVEVFEHTNVEAALAAGIFHRHEVEIASVKKSLEDARLNVRIA